MTLIAKVRTVDSYGRQQATETRRDVLCEVESVSRAEFFAAGQNGLTPDYRFRVFGAEWGGERECEYNGTRYSIYRTYQPSDHVRNNYEITPAGSITRARSSVSDYVELYAARKVGVHGE